MGLFIYASLTLIFSLLAWKRQSRFYQFLLSVTGFAFLFFFLWFTRDNYNLLQVQKTGYQFQKISKDFRSPSRTISIGGDQDRDDIFLKGFPANTVRLTPSVSDSTVKVEVAVEGVLLLKNGELINSIPLQDNDRIRFGNEEIVFTSRGVFLRGFRTANKQWSWPRKQWKTGKIKEPFFAGSFRSSLHPLSDVGKELNIEFPSKAVVTIERLHFEAGRQPVQLNRAALTGFTHQTRINDQVWPNTFQYEDGDIFRMIYVTKSGNETAFSRTPSFFVHNKESLDLVYHNPQTLGIKRELLQDVERTQRPILISTSELPYSAFPTAHYSSEASKFSGLLAFVQTHSETTYNSTLERMTAEVLGFFSMRPQTFEVITEEGAYQTHFGEQFPLGKKDRILFTVGNITFPWRMLEIVLILLLLKAIFQPPFFRTFENFAAQTMLLSVDFFLITRLLFAFRASSLYPFSQEAVPNALLAILLVPYLIFSAALCLKKAWSRAEWFNCFAYQSLLALAGYYFLPNFLRLIGLLIVTFCLVAVLRFHSAARNLRTFGASLRKLDFEKIIVVSLIVLLVLQFFGLGEAIVVGGTRISLGFFYHPLFLLSACFYLYRIGRLLPPFGATKTRPGLVWKETGKLALVFAFFFLLSFLTSDLGFFLLYCLPLLFLLSALGVVLLTQYEIRWKLTGAALAAGFLVFLLVFSSYSTIHKVLPQSYLENRYLLRILLALNPSALEESGLIAAEKQLGHQRAFLAYSHAGLTGAGYMNHTVTTALTATALNDNVPAVFLLNDFGSLGFLSFLMVAALWCWLWWNGSGGFDLSRLISLATLLTLLYTGVYMILANCGILLFTGKNVFLWGLNSLSDIFHAALLLSLILLPIRQNPAIITRTTAEEGVAYVPAEVV